ncbi:unnamed protein product, partial [Porites lobata]
MKCMVIFAPYKGIQDNLGFWIPYRGFRIAEMHAMAEIGKICQSLANMLWQSKGFPLRVAILTKMLNMATKTGLSFLSTCAILFAFE